ncbi:hypothetical protein PSYJA_38244 [Pseudomonas syringae pv. japonica str. M301072]|uniref:Uncharacterized protein n=1 Tax=Pseudomonas syringae pv. japonica str. M301072 TaxID=629262 RepID=F3FW86_PSESX|nr:hypothetical protein PSYJA_38244 [Pseudomonas syringae pv. japonica str. M301072]
MHSMRGGRVARIGDVLNVVAWLTADQAQDALGPKRGNDTRCPATPVVPSKDGFLNLQGI